MEEFDLVVIGAGPAGYTGAIRAAQLGLKVAIIDKEQQPGGTCLRVGCIPSKALLNISDKFYQAKNNYAELGIDCSVKLQVAKMLERKDKIVSDLCKGIEGLFAKNKIKRYTGVGEIITNDVVKIKGKSTEEIKAKKILIATGSEPAAPSFIKIDEKNIVSSTGALSFDKVPKHLIVIGGGYIGLELGSVWQKLGAKVTVIEFADRITPALDKELSKNLHKILEKQGLQFMLQTKVEKLDVNNNSIKVTITDSSSNKSSTIEADKVLVAVGRKPYSKDLGLEKLGIKLDKMGAIEINDKFQTSVPSIYAVGDIVRGPMLAHKAEEEAVCAVEMMQGQHGHINYNLIPGIIYTHPEVASVGLTEEQLKERGIEYKVGKFPFLANSRARAANDTDGFVKLLADAKTDKLLGGHIIGPEAGTLIAEIAAYMEFGGSAEDIARTCHGHPTLSEAIKEAALGVDKRSINI